jgi:hypothetical protein
VEERGERFPAQGSCSCTLRRSPDRIQSRGTRARFEPELFRQRLAERA